MSQRLALRHVFGCSWFWVWALIGSVAALGWLVLGTFGLAALGVAIWLAMRSRPAIRRSAFGLLTGLGIPLIYVAWANRAGPGMTCSRTATSVACSSLLNPLPWLVIGVVLVLTGVVAHTRRA